MIPLPERIAELITSLGWTFGGFERLTWYKIRVVFGRGMAYHYIDAEVSSVRSRYRSTEDLEEALYRQAARKIRAKVRAVG